MSKTTLTLSNSSTIIKYYIPAQTTNVQIAVSDAGGHVVKTIILNNKGVRQTTITTGTLPSGNYFYILWLDGKSTVTKQMVITR